MGSFCGKPVADEEHVPKAALKAASTSEVSVAAVVPSSVPVPVVGQSDATSPPDLTVEQIAISVVQSTEQILPLQSTVQDSRTVSPLQETVDPVQQIALSSHAAHSSSSDLTSVPIPSSVIALTPDHTYQPESSIPSQQDGQVAPAGVIEAPTAVSSPQPTLVPASETVVQVEVPSIAVEATSQLPQQVSGSTDPAAPPASSVTLTDYMWSPAASEGGSGIVPPLTAAVEVVSPTVEAAPVAVEAVSVEAAIVEVAPPAPVELEMPAAVSVAPPAVVKAVAAVVAEVNSSAAVATTEPVNTTTTVTTEEKAAQAELQPLHSASEIQPQLSAAAPVFTPAASTPSPSVSTSAVIQPVAAAAVAAVAAVATVVARKVVIAPIAAAGAATIPVRSVSVPSSSAAPTPVQASKGSSIPSAPAGPAVKTASHGPFHSQNGQMTTRTRVMVDFLPKKDAQEVMSKLGAIPQESAEEKAKPSKAPAAAAVPGAAVAKGKSKPKAKGKGKK